LRGARDHRAQHSGWTAAAATGRGARRAPGSVLRRGQARPAGGAGIPVRRVNRGPRPRCGSNAPREPAKTSSRAPGVRTCQQAPCQASPRAGGAVAGHVLVTAEHIITMSDGEPVVSANRPALAFQGGWITAVGVLVQLRERFPDAEVVDFGKATIVPGFND